MIRSKKSKRKRRKAAKTGKKERGGKERIEGKTRGLKISEFL